MDQPDLHQYLLWNAGGSYIFTYEFLLSAYTSFNNRTPFNAQFASRQEKATGGAGNKSSLQYKWFEKAAVGFCQQLTYLKEDWMCDGDTCGHTPSILVGDAKVSGPGREKVKHLAELSPHETDQQYLSQASKMNDRVFLSRKVERTSVKQLVAGEISADDFLQEDISTHNGTLLVNMVRRLVTDYGVVPSAYMNWLEDLGKYSSVMGYLQVTGPEGLQLIQVFHNIILFKQIQCSYLSWSWLGKFRLFWKNISF